MNRRFPRALVVEDDATVQLLMLRLIESWRWEVRGAGTVARALESLAGSPFDLVLLDLKLPDGDGSEVLAAARKLTQSPAVLVITGRPPGEIGGDVYAGSDLVLAKPTPRIEADLVLAKPFDFAILHDFVRGVADAFYRRTAPGPLA